MGVRTIVLLRHGQYDTEGSGSLTPLGRRQAEIAGKHLADLPPGSAWSSTLPRARETAAIVLAAGSRPVKATRLLREGLYTKVPGYFTTSEERREDCDRADAVWSKFFRPSKRSDRTDLLVCHGNLIRYLVCRTLRLSRSRWLRMLTNHCAVTKIVVKESGATRLLTYNETSHLPRELVT